MSFIIWIKMIVSMDRSMLFIIWIEYDYVHKSMLFNHEPKLIAGSCWILKWKQSFPAFLPLQGRIGVHSVQVKGFFFFFFFFCVSKLYL